MHLQESGEMYLETILRLKKKKGSVRAIDVAEELGYSKPSVSRAVGIMKKDGFIVVHADGLIDLTETGKDKAENIFSRHKSLTQALVVMGLSPEAAAFRDADGCSASVGLLRNEDVGDRPRVAGGSRVVDVEDRIAGGAHRRLAHAVVAALGDARAGHLARTVHRDRNRHGIRNRRAYRSAHRAADRVGNRPRAGGAGAFRFGRSVYSR